MKIFLYASLITVTQLATAQAQTVNETANYILLGEYGLHSSSSRDTSIQKNGEIWDIERKIDQISNCVYSIDLNWIKTKTDHSREVINTLTTIDFDKVSSYDVSPSQSSGKYFITLQGKEFACMSVLKNGEKRDLGCGANQVLLLYVDLPRWGKAYQYMRSKFCGGRAF